MLPCMEVVEVPGNGWAIGEKFEEILYSCWPWSTLVVGLDSCIHTHNAHFHCYFLRKPPQCGSVMKKQLWSSRISGTSLSTSTWIFYLWLMGCNQRNWSAYLCGGSIYYVWWGRSPPSSLEARSLETFICTLNQWLSLQCIYKLRVVPFNYWVWRSRSSWYHCLCFLCHT